MIDTGGTIAGAVNLLREAGARDVVIAATHGVPSDPAAERLASCGAREVIVTNTLPIDEAKRFPQLTVLSIAPAGQHNSCGVREWFGHRAFRRGRVGNSVA